MITRERHHVLLDPTPSPPNKRMKLTSERWARNRSLAAYARCYAAWLQELWEVTRW